MTQRIGPRMNEVVAYTISHPGCTPMDAAHSLRYHGRVSNRHGYAVVWRTVAARLVAVAEREDKLGCYRLWPTL